MELKEIKTKKTRDSELRIAKILDKIRKNNNNNYIVITEIITKLANDNKESIL